MNIHVPKVKIVQPEGIKYLIQEYHYTRQYAQEYIDMLIRKSEFYIEQKKLGVEIAPQITVIKLETQLENIKKFKIEEINA